MLVGLSLASCRMNKKWLKGLGCLVGTPFVLIVALVIYSVGKSLYAEAQIRFFAPTRLTATWPSNWGCDEFNEAYQVSQIKYPNSFVRWQQKGTTLIVPYPKYRRHDTTAFHSYYKDLVKAGREDTVILRGHFGYSIGVGERGWMYQCEDIPYFEVQDIYSKKGRLLKHFGSGK